MERTSHWCTAAGGYLDVVKLLIVQSLAKKGSADFFGKTAFAILQYCNDYNQRSLVVNVIWELGQLKPAMLRGCI